MLESLHIIKNWDDLLVSVISNYFRVDSFIEELINQPTVIEDEDKDMENVLQRAKKYLECTIDLDKFVDFDGNFSTWEPLNDEIIIKNHINCNVNDQSTVYGDDDVSI